MAATELTTSFTLRVPVSLKQQAQEAAWQARVSFNAWIMAAVTEKLEREAAGE
jgi:predicted HicB family RNase H-like nuclease